MKDKYKLGEDLRRTENSLKDSITTITIGLCVIVMALAVMYLITLYTSR